MRILFYFVHPAKFHLFRYTINHLNVQHDVDIVINSKDVLEALVIKEGWKYVNIFPDGRNTAKKPSVFQSGLKFIFTLIKLELLLIRRKKYDLFVTDDALVVNGWLRGTPSLIFNDNDIETIRINKILFYFASGIISPESTYLGSFSKKKIPIRGNKALAQLHPRYFSPDNSILKKYGLKERNYVIIRTAKINATHDIGNGGIDDISIKKILEFISNDPEINVIISSERELPSELNDLRFIGDPSEFVHLLTYAKIFIGDSATMASEASILGVPSILVNKLGKKCAVNRDLFEHGLQWYYDSFDDALPMFKKLYSNGNHTLLTESKKYIEGCEDFNQKLISIITSNYRS